jgi:nitric oxide reductase activation protein
MSLEAGRHNIAVYGHTADHMNVRKFASNIIYRFKAFDEKFDSVKQRFMYAYRATADILWNNDDEMAIFEVSKRFTSQKNSKTLIVISDGAPSSYRSPSIRSTRKVVEDVRSKGIKVISISISEDAVESNDEIYGKAWNVSNDDPNVVMDVIRKIAHF